MKVIKRLLALTLSLMILAVSIPEAGTVAFAAGVRDVATTVAEAVSNATAPNSGVQSTDGYASAAGSVGAAVKATNSNTRLVLPESGQLTRAEWIHDIVTVFEMTVESDALPDNYFNDLTNSHTYYKDILIAVEFGVIDVEAGEDLCPDEAATREFCASTLNFCLGYQLSSDAAYSFSDSADCADAAGAQIAIDRGRFELINGCFSPDTYITTAEAEIMLDDAANVIAVQTVDEEYESIYSFTEDVIVIDEGTEVVEDGGVLRITECPETILVGDKFAVYFNGIPSVYRAVAVSFDENVTVIETEAVDADSAFSDVDAQGVIGSEYMEVSAAEGVEVNVEDETSSSDGSKAVKKVRNITAELPLSFGGVTGKVSVKVKDPYIDYYVDSGRAYVALCGNTEVKYSISASTAAAAGLSKGFSLFTCNVMGIGSFDITLNVDFSGSASGTVTGYLVAGVECQKGSGIRAVKSFTQKEYYTSVEAQTSVSLKASLSVTKMPVLSAYVYAEVGVRANFSKKTYNAGTPKTCTHFAAYLFAGYGASAGAKFGMWKVSESLSYTIFSEANSPVRIVNHYEDGVLVPKCTRGNTYSNFFTKYNSRWSGCGWLSANGAYALNADGTYYPLYSYTLDSDNKATITKYNGYAWTVNIPKEIDGYKVVKIGSNAFENKSVRTVIIPDGVTVIGYGAFDSCRSLCNITIPNGVTLIDDYAFYNCASLTEITIPDSVTTIDEYAFGNCTSLKDVTLSKALTYLGGSAFGNTAIERIEIPKSLDIAYTSNSSYYSFNENKYYVYYGPFYNCKNLREVTFEKGTTQIAQYLFAGSIWLEEIVIPDTVTKVEQYAFQGCLRLKKATVGNAVTLIDNYAFQNCASLTEITIPDSVTTIDRYAFGNCTSLKDVTLSKALTTLGERAFGNTAIERIEIPKSLDTAYTSNSSYYSFNENKYYVYYGPFYNCKNLREVTFEKGTTQIAQYLFAGSIWLEEIVIPDTVTTVEQYAFQGCLRLKKATVGNAVTLIDNYAFQNCASLTEITIPDSVTSMGTYMFSGCSSLTDANLPNGTVNITEGTFQNCKSLKTIELPETVQYIRSRAFYGCSSLKEAILPEKTSSIGSYAFQNCVALEKVYIPESTKTVGSSAFMGCEVLSDIRISDYSITALESYVFKDCPGIKKIDLPKGLNTIGSEAFKNGTGLTAITVPESVMSISATALSYPARTVIYGKSGSYAQEFATENGFKFEDNYVAAEGISLIDGIEYVVMDRGETYRAVFEFFPEDATDVVLLSASNGNVTVNGHDLYARYTGDTVITATATSGVTYEFTVHIRNASKIAVTELPRKLSYIMGETLDLTGMKVQVTYNDSSVREITDYTVTGFDSSVEGKCTVTVNWISAYGTSYETSFDVDIVDPTPKLTGIYVATLPTKCEYQRRESLDLTGLTVMATYTDGSEKAVTDYKVTGYNALKNGTQTLTVTYGDYTDTFEVTVGVTRTLTSVSVTKTPAKTVYKIGEELDTAGLILTLTYSDGTTQDITEGFTVSGFDSAKAGTNTVTVSYGEKSTTFDVTVKAAVKLGDINGDGRIKANDALLLRRYLTGDSLTLLNKEAADVSGDGRITTRDVLIMAMYLAGKVSL